MNRIESTLASLKKQGRAMLSPYITAGDPTLEITVPLMHALVGAGADILEIGIPFSDPMAEGPVIQQAMERALVHHVTTEVVLNCIRDFRLENDYTPVVIMGYVNPVEQYGYKRFAKDASVAGVDATILVDLPPEEADEVNQIWKSHGLQSIYLCSPTTSEERMSLINQSGSGYLYYVSLKGVTGANSLDMSSLKTQYEQRKLQTTLPLMVGFGIKTPEMAAQVAQFADGVIVGAALISEVLTAFMAKKDPIAAGATLIHSMRLAMDSDGIRE